MSTMTLKMGIERYIIDAVPEITEVVQDNVNPDLAEGGFDYGF